MNTYAKYCPNVWVAKCEEKHEKGDVIEVTTKYGKENECEVHNLVAEKDGFYYYSITRTDGFNHQKWAERRAEKYEERAGKAEQKSSEYYKKSQKDNEFLSLGEPIKIGHHSERRHRKMIDDAYRNMGKSVEESNKAKELEYKAEYWRAKENEINLSMPESLEYFEEKSKILKEIFEKMKAGEIERTHSFSLEYARRDWKEAEKKLEIAKKLWG